MYIELDEKCTNSDPQKWYRAYHDDEIKKQFLVAGKAIKSLLILKHSDEIYTNKIINTKLISNMII